MDDKWLEPDSTTGPDLSPQPETVSLRARKAAPPKASQMSKFKLVLERPVKVMVNEAIRCLNQPNGSSFHAIKKYFQAHNNVDIERVTPRIRNYLKSGVVKCLLVQVKGTGVTGSFRIYVNPKKVAKKPRVGKPKTVPTPASTSQKSKKVKALKSTKKSVKKAKVKTPKAVLTEPKSTFPSTKSKKVPEETKNPTTKPSKEKLQNK